MVAGDGIGPDVARKQCASCGRVAQLDPSVQLAFAELPWGSEYCWSRQLPITRNTVALRSFHPLGKRPLFLVMLAMASGHIREHQPEKLRSLVA